LSYLCSVVIKEEVFTGVRRKIYCSAEEKYLLRRGGTAGLGRAADGTTDSGGMEA